MMVETMLESQDFGMSSALSLPQWKRELLQRRASRVRVCAPPPPPPPPPPAAPDTEELRYGPGIVKRLQSRYLSLALRDVRRRPDLRRAASLDHLAAEPPAQPPPPPPEPCPPPLPSSADFDQRPPAAISAPSRREYVKRARSVDALSRAEGASPPPPVVPRPAVPRAARPPRRPQPAVPVAERPPPDRVRAALRKFEPTATRRAPAARVAAVVRGLEAGAGPAGGDAADKRVSRAALDSIARAGVCVQYSFGREAAPQAAPVSATNPVLVARARTERGERRVGVIRPLPPAPPPREPSPPLKPKEVTPPPRIITPPPLPTSPLPEKASPILARVDLLPREESLSPERDPLLSDEAERSSPSPDREPFLAESPVLAAKREIERALTNGHREETPERNGDVLDRKSIIVKEEERKVNGIVCKIGEAKLNNGLAPASRERRGKEGVQEEAAPWPRAVRAGRAGAGGGAGGGGGGGATSVVFDFSSRGAVPDYIENDGVIRRASRSQYKAGEPGVVVLAGRPRRSSSSSSGDEAARAPSPCAVRFVNDNVLINGRGCLQRADPRRQAKLKLQFDESLTQTHEYPSESSLCEDSSPAPPAPASAPAHTFSTALPDNSHLGCVSLARYTPSKSGAAAFELGVTRQPHLERHVSETTENGKENGITTNGVEHGAENGAENGVESGAESGVSAECSWSEARALRTDLLF